MNTHPASVLVIERHPMMRSALCNAIAEEPGLNVLEANIDGRGIDSILDEVLFLPAVPGIILFGLGNPGHNEIKALEALCKTLRATPILALTSNEVPGQEHAAQQAGAHAVLTKAASRSEIIHALHETHAKHSLRHYPTTRG